MAALRSLALLRRDRQKGPKKAGLERTVPLYEKEGKDFIDFLEKNFYGRNPGEALTLRGSAYILSPRDPKDHPATPFLRLLAPSVGKAKVAKISFSFAEPEPSGSQLVVLVQGGGFAVLQKLRPRPNSTSELSFSRM